MLEKSKWIWKQGEVDADEYAEFYKSFEWNGGKCICRLSCDSDYTLFINGQFVSSNQYGDFEWYKVYDEIDITSYLKAGINHFAVLVWYFGMDSSRYIKAPAGLIYEVETDGKTVIVSDENTQSRESRGYRSRLKKWITGQLGCSFEYDATKENAWTQGEGEAFEASVCVEASFVLRADSFNGNAHSVLNGVDERIVLVFFRKAYRKVMGEGAYSV